MKKIYVLMFYNDMEASYEPVFASEEPISEDAVSIINNITEKSIKGYLDHKYYPEMSALEYSVVEVPCPE
jgi:hypothetical protein